MRCKSLLLIPLVAAWLLAILVGHGWLLAYQDGGDTPAHAPTDWPTGSALSPAEGCGTLLLFLHPHCPCSRASLEELTWVLSRTEGKAAGTVVFVCPPGAPADWAHGEYWRRVSATPGLRAVVDAGGRDACRFGATTSGQVLLYDAAGRLVFRGGITDGRGHQGDNPGRRALLDALTTGGGPYTTDVFGCPLFGADLPCAEAESACKP